MTSLLGQLVDQGKLPNVKRVPQRAQHASGEPAARNATQDLIERLEAQITPTQPVSDACWYGWLPFRIDNFLEGMRTARRQLGPGKHRFLEVGSGIGTKLVLAHALGFRPFGIERHEPYVEVSRRLAPFAPVQLGDATEFEHYGSYDLIYCYGIAASQERHREINLDITCRMKRGALFFSGRQPHPDWLEHVDGLIWRKP